MNQHQNSFWKQIKTSYTNSAGRTILFILCFLIVAVFSRDVLSQKSTILLCLCGSILIIISSTLNEFFTKSIQETQEIRKKHIGLTRDAFTGFSKKDRLFKEALILFDKGEIPKALESFLSLADQEKKFSPSEIFTVHIYTSLCYERMALFPNAIAQLRKCEFYEPSKLLVKGRIATLFMMMGDWAAAEEHFLELDAYNQSLPATQRANDVKCRCAMMYLRSLNGEKARDMYLLAKEHGENYPLCMGGLSLAYLLLHDIEQSDYYYKLAIMNHMPDIQNFKMLRNLLLEKTEMKEKEES